MILCEIFTHDLKPIGFSIKEHGDGLVCAAVSALVITICNAIEAYTDAVYTIYHSENGHVELKLTSACKDAELLVKTLELGLLQIEEQHPDDIKISHFNSSSN